MGIPSELPILVSFPVRVSEDHNNNQIKSSSLLRKKVLAAKAKNKNPRRVLMKRRAAALMEGSRRRRRRRRRRRIRGCYGIQRRVKTLKKLVPNCKECMGLDGLLRQTADYILSLQMRVRVMQIMVKVLSAASD